MTVAHKVETGQIYRVRMKYEQFKNHQNQEYVCWLLRRRHIGFFCCLWRFGSHRGIGP